MLFGSARDASFIRHVSREISRRIVGIEVAVYKIALAETRTNIYGETDKKYYHAPVKLHSFIEPDSTTTSVANFGMQDKNKNLRIGFLRDDLVDIQLSIDVGDIIMWDSDYFEVDNVSDSDYWFGRNPATLMAYNDGITNEHGYSVSIMVDTHQTSIANLDLIDNRSGVNPIENIPMNI